MWFFVQLCSSWQDFNWLKASRGPSAIAELLVYRPDALPVTREIVSKHWRKHKSNHWPDFIRSSSTIRLPREGTSFYTGSRMPIPGLDVMEPAKTWNRRIRILYFKSIGFGFVIRSQLHIHSTPKYTLNNYLLKSLYTKHRIKRKVVVRFGV